MLQATHDLQRLLGQALPVLKQSCGLGRLNANAMDPGR